MPRSSPPELAAADAFQAAALLLVDPTGLGGVRLQAGPGPVRDAWLALLRSLAPTGWPMPRLPAQVSEDRLIGGLDLPSTLAQGRPVLQRGVLAQADGGVVICAMAERLPSSSAAVLCAALDRGELPVEREGLSARLPARVAVVALDEADGEDRPMSEALADRLGLWVDLRALSWQQTVQADDALVEELLQARARLAQVQVSDEIVQALCAASLALGVDGPRACWQALRCARAAAAMRGAGEAQEEDASLAARLVLGPRATVLPPLHEPPPEDAPEPQPEPQAAPPSEPTSSPQDAAQGEPPTPPETVQALDERVIEAALAALPAGLLAQWAARERGRSRASAAGRFGAAAASARHGRSVGSRRARPAGGQRVHVLDTLRAAAPWQRLRQGPPQGAGRAWSAGIAVHPEDLHVHQRQQRRTTTTIFALDASGSSALHRLGEAKGAIELLLAQCYVRRDEVAVIAFRAAGAQLLLPPTRSLVRARRGLAGLPGGGGTPLAAGIDSAAALAQQVRRAGGTPVVVLLTDGRANVARDGQGGRERAREDALAAARALAAQGGQVVLIDTSVRPDAAARAVAQAASARYLPLPQADARALSRAVMGQLRPAGPGA